MFDQLFADVKDRAYRSLIEILIMKLAGFLVAVINALNKDPTYEVCFFFW